MHNNGLSCVVLCMIVLNKRDRIKCSIQIGLKCLSCMESKIRKGYEKISLKLYGVFNELLIDAYAEGMDSLLCEVFKVGAVVA